MCYGLSFQIREETSSDYSRSVVFHKFSFLSCDSLFIIVLASLCLTAHFIACKLRIGLKEDPIRRLCELQTAAQRRFRTPSIFSPMGWPLPPNGDNASFISDSVRFLFYYSPYLAQTHMNI